MNETIKVEHEEANSRFVIKLEGGADSAARPSSLAVSAASIEGRGAAVLQYVLRGKVMDMTHTYVPVSHRGQGLADKLTKAGFEYAREHGLTVIPTCPYISETYLHRHKEYLNLVEK